MFYFAWFAIITKMTISNIIVLKFKVLRSKNILKLDCCSAVNDVNLWKRIQKIEHFKFSKLPTTESVIT